ncbi:adenosylcobinamide-GDP ribazoletransferase [uncultured Roseobacter sp.]|uniref:adenosylcobinamide-GDP ribazoletransferase n=1 Tax=uncultured Roseobacter sp. TaxID=114847 RepID=UPI002621AB28|nr:adenosylcobinamide-GDP ribazoletransferase [uncultured Roseobacter sp.]
MKTDRLPKWLVDLLLAATLLTRLPLPRLPDMSYARMGNAVWTYPIVGAALGGLAALFGHLLLMLGLPDSFAAGGLLAILILITGAMHEDGLADSADGFWGGFDSNRRLEIMKDSHLGTYGLLALLFVTGLRWLAYASLLPLGILPVIAATALSRSAMPVLMAALPNARDSGLSHSVGRPAMPVAILGLALGLLIAGSCVGLPVFAALILTLAVAISIGALAKAKIGGQTGDVLGATQQLTEVSILAVLVIQLT